MARMATAIEAGLRLRDQFVHATIAGESAGESADGHAEVLLAVRRRRPKAAESAMRALVERSIADVELAKKVHGQNACRQPDRAECGRADGTSGRRSTGRTGLQAGRVRADGFSAGRVRADGFSAGRVPAADLTAGAGCGVSPQRP
ncbi:hypothetical protein [Nonomuraea sp. GTA35]|uniref:hypothetical protein n=1 Tax=Nonomuraea sp. GTA35 TaxID=1676746 RepID=UPI0035C02213